MQTFDDCYRIPAIDDGEMPAIEVFSLALKCLVDKMKKFIEVSTGLSDIHPRNIQWVLTNAIWNPAARQFMRKAAYKVYNRAHECHVIVVYIAVMK